MAYDDFDEPQPEQEMTREEAEDRDFEERRQREIELSDYYKGLFQGLVLGLFGNLLVSFFIEWSKELFSNSEWKIISLIGFVLMTIVTFWYAWKLYLTAGNHSEGGFFEETIKKEIKEKIKKTYCRIKPLIILTIICFLFYFLVVLIREINQTPTTQYIRWDIWLNQRVAIDVYGAILPTVISCISIITLIHSGKCNMKTYLQGFFLAVLLSILFSNFAYLIADIPNSIIMEKSLHVDYYLIGASVSGLSIIVTNKLLTHFKKLIKKDKNEKTPVKLLKIDSFLVAFSCSALSMLLLDLVFVPLIYLFSSDKTIYIGADGVFDGVLLAPVMTLFFVSIILLTIALCKELLKIKI